MSNEQLLNQLDFFGPKLLKLGLAAGLLYFGLFFASELFFSEQAEVKAVTTASAIPVTPNLQGREELIQPVSAGLPTETANSILIPKLAVEAPLTQVAGSDPADFTQPLKQGVTLYPGAEPGQVGRAVILGHSAPLGWPKINYDWVFSDISKLAAGAEIVINFNGRQYSYLVQTQQIVMPGQDLPLIDENKAELVLISCWPPGISYKRLAVFATLVD